MLFERVAPCLALLAVCNLWSTCLLVDAQTTDVEDMRHLTPTPPAAENVDCYVQVRRMEDVAGRCITLGGTNGMYACQAGANLDLFSDMCVSLRGRRYRNHRRWNPQRRPYSRGRPREVTNRK